MDILVAFFASTTILFFVACLKLGFKLIDNGKKLRDLETLAQSIFKHVIEINNNTQI